MCKASSVVASVRQQAKSSTVSDRVQKAPEGHTSPDGTTSWWPASCAQQICTKYCE